MTVSEDTLDTKAEAEAKAAGAESHLRKVNRSMARGAAWTNAMRFAIRIVGLNTRASPGACRL